MVVDACDDFALFGFGGNRERWMVGWVFCGSGDNFGGRCMGRGLGVIVDEGDG